MLISSKTKTELMSLYNEGHRFYHNISHIETSLKCLDAVADDVGLTKHGKDIVELMIWFHDAIYNVGPEVQHGDNEARSREYFLLSPEALELSVEDRMNIADAISYSARHTETLTELTKEQEIFLDIDLHSMGGDYLDFMDNGKNIRKEYSHVSEHDFVSARMKFFNNLLSKPRIYYTDAFANSFEQKTRDNIYSFFAEIS